MPQLQKSALVVSAHSADFVWRAGGAIAQHVRLGYAVHIVCLSFGERGESAQQPGQRAHAGARHRHDVNSAQGCFRIHQARFLAWA